MIEFSEDKYSKITKAIKCIMEKAEMVKDLFEEDSMNFRRDRRYDDDYDYRRGRYM